MKNKRLLKLSQPSIRQSLPELYTQKQDGCHEYSSLRYIVGTRDGSYANIGDDYEQLFSVKTIGDGEETIVKLDHCPLQPKVQQVLQSSDKDSFQEKAIKMEMFQWILRIDGISFVLLCILLLLVILSKVKKNSKESIFVLKIMWLALSIQFKAPATDLKIGNALTENLQHGGGNR